MLFEQIILSLTSDEEKFYGGVLETLSRVQAANENAENEGWVRVYFDKEFGEPSEVVFNPLKMFAVFYNLDEAGLFRWQVCVAPRPHMRAPAFTVDLNCTEGLYPPPYIGKVLIPDYEEVKIVWDSYLEQHGLWSAGLVSA